MGDLGTIIAFAYLFVYFSVPNVNCPVSVTQNISAGLKQTVDPNFQDMILPLRVTDSKYRESLDRFEKSKTLKLCLKNAFREFSSKILFRFSKNLTSSRNSQKTKIHLFTSLNMQKISGKLTKFSVFALKQFTILEHGINLAQKFHLFFYLTIGSFNFFKQFEGFRRLSNNCLFKLLCKR